MSDKMKRSSGGNTNISLVLKLPSDRLPLKHRAADPDHSRTAQSLRFQHTKASRAFQHDLDSLSKRPLPLDR